MLPYYVEGGVLPFKIYGVLSMSKDGVLPYLTWVVCFLVRERRCVNIFVLTFYLNLREIIILKVCSLVPRREG